MGAIEKKSRLRREQDILDRIENVKRLIQMETTLLTADGAETWKRYCPVDSKGQRLGSFIDDLLHDLRDTIQLQLLSITALCYGDNPDVGEPVPMLEWNTSLEGEEHPADVFRDAWDKCLIWNA
jgi:hypothetical protein